MAICSNCKSESRRVRSRWTDKGVQLADECPSCAPRTFEKFTTPSDKKIHMGFEAHPNEYEKRYDSDGVFYIRKPEYRAEQEEKLKQPCADDVEAQERAEANKRASRRTDPMTPAELEQAIAKARILAGAIEQSHAQAVKEAREAELQSWIQKASSQAAQA
ncbi:MAG: hypothetical protein JO356_01110 [Acidobacteria bacterium]|nr:hypothetical protein [Acidobacteriota bacterium]